MSCHKSRFSDFFSCNTLIVLKFQFKKNCTKVHLDLINVD